VKVEALMNAIGVVVAPGILGDISNHDLLETSYTLGESPPRINVVCHAPNKYEQESFELFNGKVVHGPNEVWFYSFPIELMDELHISDLDFPMPIVGIILTINGSLVERLIRTYDPSEVSNFENIVKRPGMGSATWASLQNLPTVVALENAKDIEMTINEIKTHLGIETNIAIITCDEKFDKEHTYMALEELFSRISP
jgi:hypothetical protein